MGHGLVCVCNITHDIHIILLTCKQKELARATYVGINVTVNTGINILTTWIHDLSISKS